MIRACMTLAVATLVAYGCASADEEAAGDGATEVPVTETASAASVACAPQADRMPLEGRASPYDSAVVDLGDAQAKVCYGRPSARERTVFGELIPFGQVWRTGANEPTTIHLPVAASIAGIAVEPGSYSLYTIPGEQEWTIIVNRSTSQWGIEAQYPPVEGQDVGRATVPAERTDAPVETFSITPGTGEIVLEWENTRVRVPVTPAG